MWGDEMPELLHRGGTMRAGQELVSTNGRNRLVMPDDLKEIYAKFWK